MQVMGTRTNLATAFQMLCILPHMSTMRARYLFVYSDIDYEFLQFHVYVIYPTSSQIGDIRQGTLKGQDANGNKYYEVSETSWLSLAIYRCIYICICIWIFPCLHSMLLIYAF
jgi:hypothetical protein